MQTTAGAAAAQAVARGAASESIRAARSWLEQEHHHLITLADAAYPALLLNTADPPVVLYVIGDARLLSRPALAIVGSRSPTARGLADAQAFAEAISNAGLCIISGLALGIDAAAHRGGLQGAGSSIAVVGTGLDRVYPQRNRSLAQALAESGALVSEFPLGTPPLRANFPRRNRIISGLSLGCLVVEAALHSGSLITAREAADQGREVFAIPGSIHSPLAKGCHWLIKQGAKLAENAHDILSELGLAATSAPSSPRPPPAAMDAQCRRLLDVLGSEALPVDVLCARTGLTADVASAMLLTLEMDGYVARLAGGLYQSLR